MIRRPPRSTLFPYTNALPICLQAGAPLHRAKAVDRLVARQRHRPGRRLPPRRIVKRRRSEEHTSELQSQFHLVCRLLLEKKKKNKIHRHSMTARKKTEFLM